MKRNKLLTIAAVFVTAVYLIFMYNNLQDNKLSKNYEVWYTDQEGKSEWFNYKGLTYVEKTLLPW